MNRVSTRTAAAPSSLATTALSATFVVMWSSGFIGGRLGTATASTVTLMVWRFALVAIALAALVRLLHHLGRSTRAIPPREIAAQALVGLLGQGVFIWGNVGAVEVGVGAGTAALIASLQPITAGVLSGPVLGRSSAPGSGPDSLLVCSG